VVTRVLILDDNLALAEDLSEILEDEGCECQISRDSRATASAAAELEFDLALVDVRMPGLDGVALHEVLRAHHPNAVFLLMTAHTSDDRIAEALAAGVREVLPKPVPLDRLLACLPVREGTILIVEDDSELASGLAETLHLEGIATRVAYTIARAREVDLSKVGAAIVDYRLPDGSGLDLAASLIDDYHKPTILITGHPDSDALRRLHPKVLLLRKPFSMDALLAAVAIAREVEC
jgi:DNA-binding response OmpR family regulator